MSKENNYKIDNDILKKYVYTVNSIDEPINNIKKQLNKMYNSNEKVNNNLINKKEGIKCIFDMINSVNELISKNHNEKGKIYIDVIMQIMKTNNGILSIRMSELLNIERQYISLMVKDNMIERVSRGIYIFPNTFEDSYFIFQQKYRMAIFSHMTALYFYDMTEEFPYSYTVTVPRSYHMDTVNKKCNVFYASDDTYELGVTEVQTPNGNKVKVYDKERCICDIIRSKSRMDSEQVQKSIREYMNSKEKNLAKLSEYSNKMGINKKVMDYIGGF